MKRLCTLTLGLGLLAATNAHADIINLSANPADANTGPSTFQTHDDPNPFTLDLAAGTYQLSIVGTLEDGGAYDAYSFNGGISYNAGFHYQIHGSDVDHLYFAGLFYDSPNAALSSYSSYAPLTLTLATDTVYDFYLAGDSLSGFDNGSGGTSILLTQIDGGAQGDTSVPEPGSLTLMGAGLLGLGVIRRRACKRRAGG